MEIKKSLSALISSTIAASGAVAIAGSHHATHAVAMAGQVPCKGVAMKQMNDCGSKAHGCAGEAAKDFEPEEWINVGSKKDCQALQKALKDKTIQDYVRKVRDGALAAAKPAPPAAGTKAP